MKAGEEQWVLVARDASYSGDKTSLLLNYPVVTMPEKDGKQVTVEAPHAVLKLQGNHVTRADLSGGAVIHYGEFVLTTNDATFLPDADQVNAPGFVTITGPEMKVTGVGMTGHPKARQFELLKQVTTELKPRSGDASKPG